MTYKISLLQNVVGGGNAIPTIYADGILFNKKKATYNI